jgi:hypothetical protein
LAVAWRGAVPQSARVTLPNVSMHGEATTALGPTFVLPFSGRLFHVEQPRTGYLRGPVSGASPSCGPVSRDSVRRGCSSGSPAPRVQPWCVPAPRTTLCTAPTPEIRARQLGRTRRRPGLRTCSADGRPCPTSLRFQTATPSSPRPRSTLPHGSATAGARGAVPLPDRPVLAPICPRPYTRPVDAASRSHSCYRSATPTPLIEGWPQWVPHSLRSAPASRRSWN